jgi:hypothetical protein
MGTMSMWLSFISNEGVNYAEVGDGGACKWHDPPSTYHFVLAEDGMLILWWHKVDKSCLDKRRFGGVMADKFLPMSSCIVGYDAVQAMVKD